MSYHHTLFLLGLWLVIVPFFGFPRPLEKILLLGTGACVMIIGLLLYQEMVHAKERVHKHHE